MPKKRALYDFYNPILSAKIAKTIDTRSAVVDRISQKLDTQIVLFIEYTRCKYHIPTTLMSKYLKFNPSNNGWYTTPVLRAKSGCNTKFSAAQFIRFALIFGYDIDDLYTFLGGKEDDPVPTLKGDMSDALALATASKETREKVMRLIMEEEKGTAYNYAKQALQAISNENDKSIQNTDAYNED